MRQRWTPEELAKLELVCGDRPWPLVVQTYNTWARESNYPERSSLALERKSQKLGIYRKTEGLWITIGAVSRILELDRATPLRWVRRGLINSWRNGESRSYPHYVRRTDFRKLARQNPCFFRPFRREQLVMLFDSEEVADYVLEHCPTPHVVPGRERPVVCVETGKKYDSIKAAAKAVFVVPPRVWAVLDTHKTAGGYHWRSLAPKAVGRCATLMGVEATAPRPEIPCITPDFR